MMNFLPLVDRELRVAVRKPTYLWLRLVSGGAGMLIIFWSAALWTSWTSTAKLGQTLFGLLTLGGFMFAAVSGLFQTADSVSQEKREGTLGFLFLTDLCSADVVFGKLTAKIVVPVYGLLATFPALAVCVFFGGVSGGEFWRLFLVLINTLLFSLSLCLVTSLFCREQRSAQAIALLAMSALLIAAPAFLAGWTPGSSPGLFGVIAAVVSPTATYLLAFDFRYQTAPGWFWMSLFCTHIVVWMSLIFACRYLGRAWRFDQWNSAPKVAGDSSRFGRARRWRVQHHLRERWLDSSPLTWLAARRRPASLLLWLLPLSLAILACIDPRSLSAQASWISVAVLALSHSAMLVWIAGWASYVCATDRKSGALELLLGTPLQTTEIATGLMRAFRGHFGPPLAALLTIDLLLASGWLSLGVVRPLWSLVAAVVTALGCYCVCWIGLWRGISSVTPTFAVLSTLATTLGLPWIWFGAAAIVFGNSTATEFVMLWLALNVGNNLIFAMKAKDAFLNYFRPMALRPFSEKRPVVESSWSPINWETAETQNELGAR